MAADGVLNLVLDVDEASFERDVLERSKSLPVVVDFWAPWCGPCRMLGPILERLHEADAGAWQLVKVDTDENPGLAMRYGIQGIPAVKAFRDGRVVSEFVGAQPEPQVRRFIAGLAPGPGDAAVRSGRAHELAGDLEAAGRDYEAALSSEELPGALVGLGRVRVEQDRLDDALRLFERVPLEAPEREEADAWITRVRFRQDARLSGGELEARRRVAAHPDDLEAKVTLASALADKGDHRAALEGLLAVLERSEGDLRDRARAGMVGIFSMLGDDHPLVEEYRPRMAAVLF